MHFSFVWKEGCGSYRYSCVCGFSETRPALEMECPRCGQSVHYLTRPSVLTIGGVYVKKSEGKFGYWARKMLYGVSKPGKDGRRHVFSRTGEMYYAVANTLSRRVYLITQPAPGEGGGPQIRALRGLRFDVKKEDLPALAGAFKDLTGYGLEPVVRAVVEQGRGHLLSAEAIFGAAKHPPIALIANHSPSAFVWLGFMLLTKTKVKLTATDPVGVLEQFFGVPLGRSVLRVMEQIEEESKHDSGLFNDGQYLWNFMKLVEEVGLDLARDVFLKHRRIRTCFWFIDVLSLYRQGLDPKTAVKRVVGLVEQNTEHWLIEDTFRMIRELRMDPSELFRLKTRQEILRLHEDLVRILEVRSIKLREEEYRARLPEIRKLEHLGEKYMIKVPEDLAEIVEEGRAMRHCVGSYVGMVAEGHTSIYFLRTLDNKRVGTIEVNDGRVVQVFGPCNSVLDREAQNFVLEWAKQHGLDTSFTYGLSSEVATELLA